MGRSFLLRARADDKRSGRNARRGARCCSQSEVEQDRSAGMASQRSASRLRRASFAASVLAGVLALSNAWGLDVITREELKETAIEYGKYAQRFDTCKIEPPASIKVAFLKYAKSRGASEKYLDLASHAFDDGRARVRNLRVGFSPEECKQKLESPKGQEILRNVEEWSKLK
jgi:hypothetical protein